MATYLVQVLLHLLLVVQVVVVHTTEQVRLEHLDKEQAAEVLQQAAHTAVVAVAVLHLLVQTEQLLLAVLAVLEQRTQFQEQASPMQAVVVVVRSTTILLAQVVQAVVAQAVREQVQPQQEHLVQPTLVVAVVVLVQLLVLGHRISAVARAALA